jgi:phosphatidate cytidylyltransferase
LKAQTPNPKPKSKLASLPPSLARVVTAAIGLPILLATILISKLALLFVVLISVAMLFALFEFWLLAKKQQIRADMVAGTLGAAALLTVFYYVEPGRNPDFLMIEVILLLLTMGTLVAAMLRGAPFARMIPSVGVTLLGVLYIVLFGGHLIAVRTGFSPDLSKDLLSFFFLVIMGADTFAYYGGRAFGRHKLAPGISPGKTWEGAISAMLASLLLAVGAHYWFFPELPLKFALPLAAVMNVVSVIGDLTESALKRSAGAKDTAAILPGHGGVLDRMDSLLFNAPLIYYFGRAYFNH